VNTGRRVAHDLFPTKTAGHKIVVDHTSKYALFLQDENQVGVKVQLPFGELKLQWTDRDKKKRRPNNKIVCRSFTLMACDEDGIVATAAEQSTRSPAEGSSVQSNDAAQKSGLQRTTSKICICEGSMK